MNSRRKKILIIALVVGIIIALFVANLYLHFLPRLSNLVNTVKKEINAPSPLRKSGENPYAYLTKEGVIDQTNIQRSQNNLFTLSENGQLDEAAREKMNDMFDRQYFDHVSPTGQGPAYWVDKEGYSYIMIGENLALGDFDNDKALVDAWMASPGHRANILNNNYTDIGVAVGKRSFEGRDTWIAVQEFGKPLSVCPQPDPALKSQIDVNNSQLGSMENQIKSLKNQIDSMNPKSNPLAYNQKVNEYNNLIAEYGSLSSDTKNLVNQYNGQVKTLNQCIGK